MNHFKSSKAFSYHFDISSVIGFSQIVSVNSKREL